MTAADDIRLVDQSPRFARLSPTEFALVIIVFTVGVRSWWLARTWFKEDDIVYLYRAVTSGFDATYLLTRRDGHFMPGAFAVVWFMERLFQTAWWPVVVVSAGLQAVAGWLIWRVFTSLMGARYVVLPLLAVVLWNPLTLASVMWWAAGMQFLPLLVGFPAVILLLQRYLRTRQRGDAWWPACALAVTLLFFEKAVLIAPFVVGLCAAVPLAEDAAATALKRLRESVRPLGYLVLVVGGFAVVYLLAPANQDATPSVNLDQIRGAGWNLVVHSFVPGLLGGPWKWAPPVIAVPSRSGTLLALAVAVFVIVSVVAVRRVLRLWLLLAAYLGAILGLISLGRVGLLGSVIGLAPRYAADAVFPAALIVGLVVFGSRHDHLPRLRFRWMARDRSSSRLDSRVVGLAICAVVIASGLLSSTRLVRWISPAGAEQYIAEASASVADLEGPVDLFAQRVPANVLHPLFVETSEAVLTLTGGPFRFVTSTPSPYFVLDTGRVVPAEVNGLEVLPRSGQPCVVNVVADTTSSVALPLAVYGWNWYVTIDYRVAQPSYLTASLDGEGVGVPIEESTTSMTFPLQGAGDRVRLGILGGPMCVERLSIGVLGAIEE